MEGIFGKEIPRGGAACKSRTSSFALLCWVALIILHTSGPASAAEIKMFQVPTTDSYP